MNAATPVPTTTVEYAVTEKYAGNPYDPALLARVRRDIEDVFSPKYIVSAAGVGGDGRAIFHLKDNVTGTLRAKVFAEPKV